jgi:hypothetical protein
VCLKKNDGFLMRFYRFNQEVFVVGGNDNYDMTEVTDSLEALSVCRLWKNASFVIVIVSMAMTQGIFWLVDLGLVSADSEPSAITRLVVDANAGPAASVAEITGGTSPLAALGITVDHLVYAIRTANGTAILGAILYCLTLQFSIGITVMGKLGGVRHVCQAFFWALLMLVLLLPWQHMLDSFALGLLYGPRELMSGHLEKSQDSFRLVLYYLRFCGLWLLGLVFLLISQIKCMTWARSILRRLEII